MKAKKAAQVLGVNEGDDEATITAAFRTRAAQRLPDRNEGNRDEATRRFEEINRAFRALNQNGNTAGEAMDLSEMLLFFQFMMGGASQPTEDAAALSVSELKKRLEERGVDYAGCVEKSDLVELLERETAEDQRRVAKARRAARKKAQQRRKKAREKAERNSSEEQDAALVRVADAVSSGDAALARSALDEAERAHLAPGDKYARLFEHARELVRRADEDEARAREAAASEKASREKLEAKKERREARRRAEERAEAEARRKKELREAARKEKKQKRREAPDIAHRRRETHEQSEACRHRNPERRCQPGSPAFPERYPYPDRRPGNRHRQQKPVNRIAGGIAPKRQQRGRY